MEIGHLPGKAIEAFKNRGKSGAGGCSSNDQESSGIRGGGGIIPPGESGPNVVGGGAPSVARPIGDVSSISDEARTGGGGSSDLAGIKELLGGLCG